MTKLAKEWELQSDDNARAYRQKVTELQQALDRIKGLEVINEQHRVLNGELRVKIAELEKIIYQS